MVKLKQLDTSFSVQSSQVLWSELLKWLDFCSVTSNEIGDRLIQFLGLFQGGRILHRKIFTIWFAAIWII